MVKIIEPKIETAELKSDGTYGRFVAEPLDRGFGTTLGNSLRRVLLSSLPGVAVISVKIDGIQHEFSTIPGVKEDVTEIILNIKGLTAKLYTDGPKTVVIDAEGECEVTAGSIETDAEVVILDPSMHTVSYTHLDVYKRQALALLQATAYYLMLKNFNAVQFVDGGVGMFTAAVIILTFTGGSCLLVWLGEQIDKKGIGNGISMILFAGIVSRGPALVGEVWKYMRLAMAGESKYFISVPLILVLFIAVIAFIVLMLSLIHI